jgi:hypothetical protein
VSSGGTDKTLLRVVRSHPWRDDRRVVDAARGEFPSEVTPWLSQLQAETQVPAIRHDRESLLLLFKEPRSLSIQDRGFLEHSQESTAPSLCRLCQSGPPKVMLFLSDCFRKLVDSRQLHSDLLYSSLPTKAMRTGHTTSRGFRLSRFLGVWLRTSFWLTQSTSSKRRV